MSKWVAMKATPTGTLRALNQLCTRAYGLPVRPILRHFVNWDHEG